MDDLAGLHTQLRREETYRNRIFTSQRKLEDIERERILVTTILERIEVTPDPEVLVSRGSFSLRLPKQIAKSVLGKDQLFLTTQADRLQKEIVDACQKLEETERSP
ncbi:hypothetical protein PAPYR_1265 [Paratrimastix pyriformis]|uniref:Uncharacterized protein n=1 Tax=Paratrimastix pyriformis TaxID=342808 RepID=A0ABQ8UVG3_9EUKA|nr:hypothetical protein PAPYR_1265 [Paratrimastix pyriformis]